MLDAEDFAMLDVYFDCDNTMGLPGCDLDDGLALLYLLGREDVRLRGVTTSFGNSAIERVHPNTERMFRELGLTDIPLKQGAASPAQRSSEAAHFLAADIPRCPRPVTLLVTGSPTNIYAACLENAGLLDNVAELVFMGGVTEPLLVGGKPMRELNFSSDPDAMHSLLNCPVKKTIASAHLCLDAFFDRRMMDTVLRAPDIPAFASMREPLRLWYDFISAQYGLPGFHAWDLTAAVAITHPDLFDRNVARCISTPEDLQSGFLRLERTACAVDDASGIVNLPTRIRDIERFWQVVFDAWHALALPVHEIPIVPQERSFPF